jgi:hypothetical protein
LIATAALIPQHPKEICMSASAKPSITVTLDGTNRSLHIPLLEGTIGPPVADIRKLYGDRGVRKQDHLHRRR